MKKYFIWIILMYLSSSCIAQVDTKVDSVFQEYFNFIQQDTLVDFSNIKQLNIVMEKGSIIQHFFVNITCIQMKQDHDYSGTYYTDEVIFQKWRKWYNLNKDNLIWVDDNFQIKKNKECFAGRYVEFVGMYPFQIRFKDKKNKVPNCSDYED